MSYEAHVRRLVLEGMAMLLSVDWFPDRFRTTVKVWGDSVLERLRSGGGGG